MNWLSAHSYVMLVVRDCLSLLLAAIAVVLAKQAITLGRRQEDFAKAQTDIATRQMEIAEKQQKVLDDQAKRASQLVISVEAEEPDVARECYPYRVHLINKGSKPARDVDWSIGLPCGGVCESVEVHEFASGDQIKRLPTSHEGFWYYSSKEPGPVYHFGIALLVAIIRVKGIGAAPPPAISVNWIVVCDDGSVRKTVSVDPWKPA
jgi:hypothetical protein